jgi:hypothetical protein
VLLDLALDQLVENLAAPQWAVKILDSQTEEEVSLATGEQDAGIE